MDDLDQRMFARARVEREKGNHRPWRTMGENFPGEVFSLAFPRRLARSLYEFVYRELRESVDAGAISWNQEAAVDGGAYIILCRNQIDAMKLKLVFEELHD